MILSKDLDGMQIGCTSIRVQGNLNKTMEKLRILMWQEKNSFHTNRNVVGKLLCIYIILENFLLIFAKTIFSLETVSK